MSDAVQAERVCSIWTQTNLALGNAIARRLLKGSPALITKDLVAHTTVEREGEQPRDCPGLCRTVQYTVRRCSVDSMVTAPTVTAKGRCVLKPTTRNRVVDFLSFFLDTDEFG